MSRSGWGAVRGAVAGVVFFAGLSSAHAEAESPTRVHVTYAADRADRTCPTSEQFLAQVRRYTTNWSLAGEPSARRFRVILTPRRAAGHVETSGRLEIEEPSKAPAVRHIVGPDCESVGRALAIALAVVIDPEADLTGGAKGDSKEAVAEATGAGESVNRSLDGSAASEIAGPDRPSEPLVTPSAPSAPLAPSSAPSAPSVLPARDAPRPPSALEPSTPRTSLLRASALVGATAAVTDRPVLVLGASAELEPLAHRPGSALPRWLRPSVSLGFRQSMPRDIEQSGMVSTFLWTAGTLQLCPVRWSTLGDRFELTPCFESNAGVLNASARGSHDSRSSRKPWLDLGGTAKATWRVHRTWFVGGTFSVVAPVTRYQFELSTRASVSRAPAVGSAFGVIAGLGF